MRLPIQSAPVDRTVSIAQIDNGVEASKIPIGPILSALGIFGSLAQLPLPLLKPIVCPKCPSLPGFLAIACKAIFC
ncbi:MAG: hypothetical protein KA716_19455 [Gloeotrichia echinulata DEX184]|nr:hypothetical protein [Gloeotrichia echinulata DEX184]